MGLILIRDSDFPVPRRDKCTAMGARDVSSAAFRFLSSLHSSWLRPKAEAVSAFGRKFPPHARKTSGIQGYDK